MLEPKLKGIILSNVFESAGRYLLTPHKLEWLDEFDYWIEKLKQTEPALADIYKERLNNNRRYIR